MNLNENLIKYKNITLNIIQTVKDDKYEKLDELFNKRQLILDNINKLDYSKEELKMYYVQCEIEKSEKILTCEIKARKQNLLEKIKVNNKRQAAVVGYNKLSTNSVFLSKKI